MVTWQDVRTHAIWLVLTASAALLLLVADTPTIRVLVDGLMVANLFHLVYWTLEFRRRAER